MADQIQRIVADQAAQIHELYSNGLHQGLAALELGNDSLGKEQSLKWSNDIRWQAGEESQVSVSLYYHYIRDYIYLAPTLENRLHHQGQLSCIFIPAG